MLKNRLQLICLGIVMAFVTMLSGCGGSSGGAADLNTVSVTATSASTNIDGDVASEITSVDTDGDGIDDSITYSIPSRNTVTVNIRSIINTTSSTIASNLRVDSVAVTYVRKSLTANSGASVPIIPTRVDPVGVTIIAGNSVDIPITVVTQEIKSFYANTLISSGDIYAYDVTLTFNVVEVSTGKSGTVSTALVVRIANFADV